MNAERAAQLRPILLYLEANSVSLHELLLSVLVHGHCADPSTRFYSDLISNTESILSAFLYHTPTSAKTGQWSHRLMTGRYSAALQRLASPSHGWHFSAMNARPEQLRDFKIEEMAAEIVRSEPEIWSLFRALFRGSSQDDIEMCGGVSESESDEAEPDPDDDDLWKLVGDLPGEEGSSALENGHAKLGHKARRRLRELRNSLADVKSVVVISVVLQHRNQRCNTLQSTFGVFLHSCNAPEKLIKVLAHMGLSVSLASVHRLLKSLSTQCEYEIYELGQTLMISHGYDNFDAEAAMLIRTVDSSKERLMHLTSGAIFRLNHVESIEVLRCSKLLWDRSELNPYASDPRPFVPHAAFLRLLMLHPEPPTPESGLSRRSRFRAWFFMKTLCEHGPPYFRQFFTSLRDPEPVEMIPIKKLEYLPCRAMDINQSKVAGNIEAIQNLLTQSGLGDPSRPRSSDLKDISEYVTIMHGDLGTYERVLGAKRQRSQEKTPYNRLQSVEFAIGLFHLKMAAADAIWRAEVAPEHAREDATSFMQIAAKLRPDDSSRLVSNAKYREQHELIGDVGTVLRLDAWRVEIAAMAGHESLEVWARTKPKLGDIEEVAAALVRNYVEGAGMDLYAHGMRAASVRDAVQENTCRTHHHLFLYEELSYSMNAGDIGRLETVLVPWVLLFRATGKHKYGTQTLRFIHALYEVYPEGLRNAMRYNMLVNPTGKPHHFRAIDWIIELLNFYIKEMYGGSGPNNTKARILLESILVLLFRNSHSNFERNFQLGGLSFAHAKKDMRKAYEAALKYLEDENKQPHTYKPGRTTKYHKPDLVGRGAATLEKEGDARRRENGAQEDGGEELTEQLTADDLSTEGAI